MAPTPRCTNETLVDNGEDVSGSTLLLVNRNGLCATRRCETEDPKRHAFNNFAVTKPLLSAGTPCMYVCVIRRVIECSAAQSQITNGEVEPPARSQQDSNDDESEQYFYRKLIQLLRLTLLSQ